MKTNGKYKKKHDSAVTSVLGLQDETQARFAIAQLVGVGLRVLGADEGSLLVANPRGKTLRFAMVCGPDGMPPKSGTAASMVGKEIPIGEGVTGMAALTHDVQCASAASGPEATAFHRVAGDGSPQAVLAAPMLLGDALVGVITAVSFDRRKSFSAEDARTYGMLANAAAAVIDQQLRLEAVAQHGKDSSQTAGDAIDGNASEERALLEETLAFVRARPGRAAALRDLITALSRVP